VRLEAQGGSKRRSLFKAFKSFGLAHAVELVQPTENLEFED
jgi:hypothetical protein